MAEPKLLISDDDYEKIKILAAKERVRPQDLMRRAVLSVLSEKNDQTSAISASAKSAVDNDLATIQRRSPVMAQRLRGLIADAAKVLTSEDHPK